VLDFGLAKLVAGRQPVGVAPLPITEDVEGPLSSPGTVMGTVAYMSPEQAQGQELDARTDLFTFGVVLYEMATGRRPFEGKTSAVLFDAILNKTPISPMELNPAVPVELEHIITKALEKDRELRHQTAAELRADLKRLKRDLDSGQARAVRVTTTATPVPPPQRLSPLFGWLAAVVSLALVLGGAVWLQFFTSSKPVLPTLRHVPFTTEPGRNYQPAFSPDGNQIAFVWDGAKHGNSDIYVKDVRTGGEPKRLTEGPANIFSPVWRPPDGSHIAFAHYDQEKGEGGVYLVDALTGSRPIRLCSQSLPGPLIPGALFCSLTWSPDGKTLAFPSRETANGPVGIFLFSPETDEKPQQGTRPSAGLGGDYLPAFSPDGKWLAFLRDRSHRAGDIYVMPAAGGEPRRLTEENLYIAGLAWTPDSREIVFSSPRGGLRRLWRIAATPGSKPEALSGVGEEASDVAIAPKGDRLAYVRALEHVHLWRMKRPATSAERPTATRFVPSPRLEANAQYSQDGKWVTFASDRSGSLEIWVCDSEGRKPFKVTSFAPHSTGTPRFSPDGQYVAFDSRKSGQSAIWVVGVENGRYRQLTTGQEDTIPSWSRKQQWVYFSSTRSGSDQIWKVRVQEGQQGQEVRLTTKQGGRTPFESADGQWVYYYAQTTPPSIWKVSVKGGEESVVLQMPRGRRWGAWTLAEQGIYFLDLQARPGPTVQFFDFASQQSNAIAQLEKNPSEDIAFCTVSPDGQWILYSVRSFSWDIMLVEHFR
jgi:Tol biopolymer transport system component